MMKREKKREREREKKRGEKKGEGRERDTIFDKDNRRKKREKPLASLFSLSLSTRTRLNCSFFTALRLLPLMEAAMLRDEAHEAGRRVSSQRGVSIPSTTAANDDDARLNRRCSPCF